MLRRSKIPYVPAGVYDYLRKRSYEIIMVKKIICTFHNKFIQCRRAGACKSVIN